MDYELSKVGEHSRMAYGNTWAAEIRAFNPSIPVIGISHEREDAIPKLRIESFLAFYPRDRLMGINPPLEELSSLLTGYHRVCQLQENSTNKSGVDKISDLISPPVSTAELLKAAIPPTLRGDWDIETPHVVSRWLWHEFQGLPGFLFDELSMATYLGLNHKGFQKIQSKFESARYKGAFSTNARPRWWVSMIRGVFEEITGIRVAGAIAEARGELLKNLRIKPAERNGMLSRAHGHSTSSTIPNCVAYRDDQREENDRVQALFEDTFVDERDANPAFGFEPRRIYGPTKKG